MIDKAETLLSMGRRHFLISIRPIVVRLYSVISIYHPEIHSDAVLAVVAIGKFNLQDPPMHKRRSRVSNYWRQPNGLIQTLSSGCVGLTSGLFEG